MDCKTTIGIYRISGLSGNMETYDQKVKRLADTWMLYATAIEAELCDGFDTSEPTRLMYAVLHEMTKIDPLKAAQFEKFFFSHLR